MLFGLWRSIKQKRLENTDLVHPHVFVWTSLGLPGTVLHCVKRVREVMKVLAVGNLTVGNFLEVL